MLALIILLLFITGKMAFLRTLCASRFAQGLLSISAARPLARVMNVVSVRVASVAASLAADRALAALCALERAPPKRTLESLSFGKGYRQTEEEKMLWALRRHAMMESLLFREMGGRFHKLSLATWRAQGHFIAMKARFPPQRITRPHRKE